MPKRNQLTIKEKLEFLNTEDLELDYLCVQLRGFIHIVKPKNSTNIKSLFVTKYYFPELHEAIYNIHLKNLYNNNKELFDLHLKEDPMFSSLTRSERVIIINDLKKKLTKQLKA